MTIPSATDKAISVGAYDTSTDKVATFSGRGFTRENNQIKPDIVAPGVNIRSAATGGGTTVLSGTSMATPFVTGSAALMMEWGIVRGNDPYLYGEKNKSVSDTWCKSICRDMSSGLINRQGGERCV